ncbi:hypothetical protein [Cardinium endosymbiont of Culicoides punctatus]|uniref:hypothetical protein n=1 Tax=Cardinium endosymbiont of Culicoides punctatus TaxID=2304601 RepID=UPI0010587E55|nr:hypothetical protein [Cardinium endosymbiont of Culicoides punctatus]TDG95408.1 hypothetical protein CCPUN_03840 [Cardinium endosymbiont of Culicoides punctatus]
MAKASTTLIEGAGRLAANFVTGKVTNKVSKKLVNALQNHGNKNGKVIGDAEEKIGSSSSSGLETGNGKIPEGFSKMAKGDRPSIPGKDGHYIEPRTLNQQLALKEAMSGGGGNGVTIKKILTKNPAEVTRKIHLLTDPRLKDLNVEKYKYLREFTDPKTGEVIDRVQIHYFKDSTTGEIFDVKFKDIGY